MKKIIYLFIYLFLCNTSFSQSKDSKRDYQWLIGYDSKFHTTGVDSVWGNSIINFNFKPPKSYFQYTDMNFNDDIAVISDTSGQLLFYTNGIYIADKTHQPMKNGEGLNPGKSANNNKKYGLINCQGSLILPKPKSNNLYYLIHSSVILDLVDGFYKGENLYYTIIDINKNNGKGEVIEKNQKLSEKFIDFGKITATRHANGIDWWIIVADFDTKNYNVFLLSSEGIKLVEKQTFLQGFKGGLGQAVFSPDGTKYARFNAYSISDGTYIDIFDFNRCTGKLSNQKHWNYTTDTTYSGGIAISPNSKYLYVMPYKKIYQFDLQANDVFSTLDTVAVHDGVTYNGFSTRFYLAQLAPDNKIYITIPSTSIYYHVIEDPDKKGKACNVKQRGFKLPTKNYTTIPNFPYFRLGAAANQCITSTNERIDENIKIYPNPASDYLYLDYDKTQLQHSQLIITDIQGKILLQKTLNDNEIDVSNFTQGVYFLQILKENKVVFREKVVILE